MVLNKIKDKIKPFCNCLIIIVLTVLPVKWGYALEHPNVLLIIADDLTYSDLPLYGGMNIETPNIDRLGKEGLVFNHAIFQPLCVYQADRHCIQGCTLYETVLHGITPLLDLVQKVSYTD